MVKHSEGSEVLWSQLVNERAESSRDWSDTLQGLLSTSSLGCLLHLFPGSTTGYLHIAKTKSLKPRNHAECRIDMFPLIESQQALPPCITPYARQSNSSHTGTPCTLGDQSMNKWIRVNGCKWQCEPTQHCFCNPSMPPDHTEILPMLFSFNYQSIFLSAFTCTWLHLLCFRISILNHGRWLRNETGKRNHDCQCSNRYHLVRIYGI